MPNLISKKFILGGLGVVGVLLLVMVVVIFLKSQTSTPKPVARNIPTTPQVQRVDLDSQPEWVKQLEVSVTRGRSPNGLANVTVKVVGIPEGLVDSVDYVLQYQTSNKGSQGALSTKSLELKGATTWSKTIDLGTCSTNTCIDHQGVTAVDLEVDFNTSEGRFVWTNTIEL